MAPVAPRKKPSQRISKAPQGLVRPPPPCSPSLTWSSHAPPSHWPLSILQCLLLSASGPLYLQLPLFLFSQLHWPMSPVFTKQLKCHFLGETYHLPSCPLLLLTAFATTIVICMVSFLVCIALARLRAAWTRDCVCVTHHCFANI